MVIIESEIGTWLLTFFEVKIYDSYGGGQDCGGDYNDKSPPIVVHVQISATLFHLSYQPGPKYIKIHFGGLDGPCNQKSFENDFFKKINQE